MQSYRYDNHTVLIFGKGKHKEAGIEIKKYGKRALIVFYGEPYERKLIDEIEESLEENDVDYWEFTGVKPNPEMAPVLLAIELVKEKKIDFIEMFKHADEYLYEEKKKRRKTVCRNVNFENS